MNRNIFFLISFIILSSCAELQQVIDELPESTTGVSNLEIASGLREALDQGIDKQVSKLTQTDGYYKMIDSNFDRNLFEDSQHLVQFQVP